MGRSHQQTNSHQMAQLAPYSHQGAKHSLCNQVQRISTFVLALLVSQSTAVRQCSAIVEDYKKSCHIFAFTRTQTTAVS
jgi:hypothetical protein